VAQTKPSATARHRLINPSRSHTEAQRQKTQRLAYGIGWQTQHLAYGIGLQNQRLACGIGWQNQRLACGIGWKKAKNTVVQTPR
jgi:hypothetical protein